MVDVIDKFDIYFPPVIFSLTLHGKDKLMQWRKIYNYVYKLMDAFAQVCTPKHFTYSSHSQIFSQPHIYKDNPAAG